MKRRSFLKLLVALPVCGLVAPFLEPLEKTEPEADDIKEPGIGVLARLKKLQRGREAWIRDWRHVADHIHIK